MSRDEIKDVMEEVLNDRFGRFHVAPETHYRHHEFIERLIKLTDKILGTACGAVTKFVIGGIIILLLLGFGLWIKQQVTP